VNWRACRGAEEELAVNLSVEAAGEDAGGWVITGRPRRQGSAGALSKGTREIVQEETEEGAGGTRKCCED